MDMNEATDPFALFDIWFAAARESEPSNPNAMSLASIGPDGLPSVRIVLLKGFDRRGPVFYTNLESRKGTELTANPNAALCFHWKALERQARIVGTVARVGDDEADAYFAGRPRDSQIGAWASQQSRPLDHRATLEARTKEFHQKFEGGPVPRPPYWSGFRLTPTRFEFWQERPWRLHDRIEFNRDGDGWTPRRLYP